MPTQIILLKGYCNKRCPLYDTIRSIPNVVSGIGMGAVANYSALLLAGCKKGSRFALNHCRFTIEQPYGALHDGTNQQTEIAIAAREVSLEREVMEELFVLHTGQSLDKVHSDIELGLELDARQAVEYGLVDEVIE